MKTLIKSIALTAITIFVASTSITKAANINDISVPFVYSVTNTSATNLIFGVKSNGIWPNVIVGGQIVTNFTKFDVSRGENTAIQFTAATTASVGAVAGQTIVMNVWRSVQGGTPTNSIGTGISGDIVCKLTLNPAVNTSGPWTICTNLSSVLGQEGAIPTMYVTSIDVSGITNIVSLTNYAAWYKNQ